MKIALINDQHLGARNDNQIFHNYFAKFYQQFFFPTLEREGITTIFNLGDLFDRRKFINYDTLDRCREYFFNELKTRNLEFKGIVGNHDVYYKSTNRVNAPNLLLQEYGFTFYTSPVEESYGGTKFLFLPWINVGNYKECMDAIEESTASVVLAHLELQGFEMYRGAVNDHGLSHKLFSKFNYVFTGHFHHKSVKDNIHYLGAPYEMTWSDYDDPRGFHVFDTETQELTYHQNPYTIFNKVFYDDAQKTEKELISQDFSHIEGGYVKVVVKNKDNPYFFDLFIDRLNSFDPANLQVVEDNFNLNIEDESEILSEAEDTVTIIRKYINSLGVDNKKGIENLFYELYHDALSIE